MIWGPDPDPEDAQAESLLVRVRQDALLRLWDTQEQLEGAQVELTRLRGALAGFQKACELLWSAAVTSQTQRMQDNAALSGRIVELTNQVLTLHKQGAGVTLTHATVWIAPYSHHSSSF